MSGDDGTPVQYHRILSPRVVALVTALRPDGLPNTMAAAWHTPVSINPPILAVSISPDRTTHQLIQEMGEFTISVPDESLLRGVIECGSRSGAEEDKSKIFEYVPGTRLRTPILKNAIGTIECTLNRVLEMGDHSVIFGNVVAADANGLSEIWISRSPLLHLGSIYYVKMANRINSKEID
jgi:flavin reductase (DIM6/NTAB) family NADH-FMN oxidoreductase RutF